MRPVRATLLLLALGLLGGCLDALAPEVGPPNQNGTCSLSDSNPAAAVQFARDIQDGIFQPSCDRCHLPGGDDPIGVRMSGLDLSSYDTLRQGGDNTGPDIVIPGDPCDSLLVQKLSDAPPFGARMPLNRSPLSAADQQLIRDWIAEGAPDN